MGTDTIATSPTILVDARAVGERIAVLATEVIAQYGHEKPLFVCLLRGGVPFASGLMCAIVEQDPDFHPELEYMKITTYGDGREARTPEVLTGMDEAVINGRTVVILDDVLDTGRTPAAVEAYLRSRGAADVKLIVLAQKQKERSQWQQATLYGFEVPDVWLVGMGCDDATVAPEAYRWAPFIGAVPGEA